jgi:hypothetical protein
MNILDLVPSSRSDILLVLCLASWENQNHICKKAGKFDTHTNRFLKQHKFKCISHMFHNVRYRY